ncbi:MAG: ATP-binding protein, partial [Candidatus Roizmanbacteria bacterium]|nr:ATP-binding protein [Candidatus Roizmanbacteria bacterium]
LREQVLEVRRNEKNFLHYKNEEYFKNLHNVILILTSSINSISAKTVKEIGKENFLILSESIRTFSNLIYNLYKNYQQETNVIEEVRAEGRKLETLVAGGKHAKELTTSFVLHLRLLEKNYMLFRNKESSVKLDNALMQLKNITPFCFKCTPYIEAISNLFETYEESDKMVNDLQTIGDRLEKITEKIASHERKRISSFLTQTHRLLLGLLVILCTLGPFLVYKTANRIAAPIMKLAEITKKISNGDLTLRAPLKEHDETYSLALSFNTMLDHLQMTQQSLEGSIELLREKQTQLVKSEKLASIGTLASGVAHELNNPLNNIYLAAQILSREIGEDNYPKIIKECVRDIFSQTLRVKRIVSDLLEFAREKPPELRRINIIKVINDVLTQMIVSGEILNVSPKLEAPESIEVFADSHLLEQIFINLFSNAVDAMEGRGILDIKANELNSSVKIKISDTGRGIPQEIIPRIFDPFFTTKEKGTGLGLAIVYGIIGKHGGEIEVKSEMNKGTVFTIMLPRGI